MKIVFMGTPQFAIETLEMLIEQHNVILVVSQPDKPVGRKRMLQQSPVKQVAVANQIPVFQPEKLTKDYQIILDLKPDMIITAAYGQMLPKELLDKITALNVHGSLLPAYRGGAPIQYALFDGLAQTGVTIMYMALKMDSGDIIKQKIVEIDEADNYLTLSRKLSVSGKQALQEVLEDLEKNIIHRMPQEQSKITYAYTIKRSDEQICFSQTTKRIINRIRGVSPEPGAYALINNSLIKFYEARKSDIISSSDVSGMVLCIKKKLIVKTKDGAAEILTIQAPGKKKMNTKDFLNGQNIIKKNDVFARKE